MAGRLGARRHRRPVSVAVDPGPQDVQQDPGQDEADDQGDQGDPSQGQTQSPPPQGQQDQPAGEFGAEEPDGFVLSPQVRSILGGLARARQATDRRGCLLEPNKDTSLDIERYTWGIAADQLIQFNGAGHTPPANLTGSGSPDCDFRPQRVTTNALSPGFVLLNTALIANVSYVVGGTIDAWQLNSNAWDEDLDLPTITPANKARYSATYTGLVPPPFRFETWQFSLSFSGPATMTGLLTGDAMGVDDIEEPT